MTTIKGVTKRVFSLKFSVFSDRGLPSVDRTDSELIRVPGFGRYRKPTVGIGRLKFFRLSDFQIIRLGPGEMGISNFECESRTVDVGNRRWMTVKKFYWLVAIAGWNCSTVGCGRL
jgi:hypothetical protein